MADQILDEYYAHRLKWQQKQPRQSLPRYSFAQSVPLTAFEKGISNITLKDGGSSLVVANNGSE